MNSLIFKTRPVDKSVKAVYMNSKAYDPSSFEQIQKGKKQRTAMLRKMLNHVLHGIAGFLILSFIMGLGYVAIVLNSIQQPDRYLAVKIYQVCMPSDRAHEFSVTKDQVTIGCRSKSGSITYHVIPRPE